MFSDLDLIGRGYGPGPIHRFRPIRPARPRRGDWHRLDPMPAPVPGPGAWPSGWFWLLVGALAAGLALSPPHPTEHPTAPAVPPAALT